MAPDPKSPQPNLHPSDLNKVQNHETGERKPSAALCVEEREFAGPNRRRTDKIALGARHGEKRRGEEDEMKH